MVRILAFLTALAFAVPAAAGLPGISKGQVETICSDHYQRLVGDIVGALNMGMTAEAVKANLTGGKSNAQLDILLRLVDAIAARNDAEAKSTYDSLIAQCVQENYNPKQKM